MHPLYTAKTCGSWLDLDCSMPSNTWCKVWYKEWCERRSMISTMRSVWSKLVQSYMQLHNPTSCKLLLLRGTRLRLAGRRRVSVKGIAGSIATFVKACMIHWFIESDRYVLIFENAITDIRERKPRIFFWMMDESKPPKLWPDEWVFSTRHGKKIYAEKFNNFSEVCNTTHIVSVWWNIEDIQSYIHFYQVPISWAMTLMIVASVQFTMPSLAYPQEEKDDFNLKIFDLRYQ